MVAHLIKTDLGPRVNFAPLDRDSFYWNKLSFETNPFLSSTVSAVILGRGGILSKNDVQRLTLENFIFWRAWQLGTKVYGISGHLACPHADPYLQVGIYLYNACFAGPSDVVYPLPNPWPYGGVKNGWIICWKRLDFFFATFHLMI